MGTTFELFLHLILINGMPRSAYSCASLTANTALLLLKKGDKLVIEHIRLRGNQFKGVDCIYFLQHVNDKNDDTWYFAGRGKMLDFVMKMDIDDFMRSKFHAVAV